MTTSALVRSKPDHIDDQGRQGYVPQNHPALLARVALHRRLGIQASGDMLYLSKERAEAFRRKASLPSETVDPTALFGDLAETTFWSRESFRERMVRAVEDNAWRERVRKDICERVLKRFTYDALVPRLIDLVAAGVARVAAERMDKAA